MSKLTTNAMNRVPPYMPILWQDWESDPDISTMTDLQIGIFFKMLLRQWTVGSVPANVSDVIRECKLDSGRNTVLRFLEAYPHLWTCDGCGTDFVRTECGCSTDVARTSSGRSTDATRAQHGRRVYTRRTNQKYSNLRKDVTSGLELGTTKPNRTKPEPEQKPTARCTPSSGSEPDDPASQGVQDTPVPPEQEQLPVLLQVNLAAPATQELKREAAPTATPRQEAKPELADIRHWSEDRFGIPGSRLQNCIIFQLDYSKNPWYRQNPPTMASMEREKFVTKLDKDTPLGWSPETHNLKPEKQIDTSAHDAALDMARKYGAKIC